MDAERLTLEDVLKRYLEEVAVTKRATTADAEQNHAKRLLDELGGYSLAAISPSIIANFRDRRLADGRSNNTVRLELALLPHTYTIAIQERLGPDVVAYVELVGRERLRPVPGNFRWRASGR